MILRLFDRQVTNVYVRNLSLTTTEQYLRDIFNRVSNNDVQRVKMMRDFAFVHFLSRESAEKAIQTLNGNNCQIEYIILTIFKCF